MKTTHGAAIAIGLFGAALLYGDGMITPAISVLSAVEGLGVATHALEPYIVPITVAILIVLFLMQHRGTGGIGEVFGPIMIVWFVGDRDPGTARSIVRSPSVLRAFKPRYAVKFFERTAFAAFLTLGAVFLAVTGAEALYADMGHFGTRADPDRLVRARAAGAAPQLLRPGRDAALRHPQRVENPFYRAGAGHGRSIRWSCSRRSRPSSRRRQ